VLIMHRLHEDDLTGYVLAQEEWKIVRRPAVAEEEGNLRGLVHRYLILWCAFPCTATIGSSKTTAPGSACAWRCHAQRTPAGEIDRPR